MMAQLSALIGRWRFVRSLVGRPYCGSVVGTAEFAPAVLAPDIAHAVVSSPAFAHEGGQRVLAAVNAAHAGAAVVVLLQYSEEGQLRIDGHSSEAALPVTQRYLYSATSAAGSPVRVWFSDGRPFLALDFAADRSADGEMRATDTHLCGDDSYDAAYAVAGDASRITIRFRVRGPEKDYTSDTTFTRVP